jgi:ElaB/YqjD/DUF883 family membrane-anchored ribosome-binding protein
MDEQYNGSDSFSGGTGTATKVQQTITDSVNEAKEKVAQYGRTAVDKINAQREPTASALEQTASTIHEKSDKAAGVAHLTAEKIHNVADYIRDNDVKSMTDDLGSIVRRYPGPSLAVAAFAGFLVARALRRSD